MKDIFSKINNLEKLIGNTPLVEILFKYKEVDFENIFSFNN